MNFKAKLSQFITNYCRPMVPLVIKLWEEVFPHGQIWNTKDETLYGRMKAVLGKARETLQIEVFQGPPAFKMFP